MKFKRTLEVLAIVGLIFGLSGCKGGSSIALTAIPENVQGLEADVTEAALAQTSARPITETASAPANATPGPFPTPQTLPTRPASGPTTTPPAPPLEPIPGIELNRMDQPSVDLVAQANGYWVRRNALKWSDVEPEEGSRNWAAVSGLEQEIQTVMQQGLGLVLVVRSTPAWAQQKSGYLCGPVSSDKLNSFADFMYEAVQRYSVPPYNVKYWELWNEPDIDPSLVDQDSEYGCWVYTVAAVVA